ncbi:MAG: hypothetical protein J2P43_03260, partial [Candidatus Dormibacteraeota bacterium]|nr:hypothetical protein [Candidatus Dormibacteraeota bacterium]
MGSLSLMTPGYRARERTQVCVVAGDPVSRDGAASLLRGQGVDLVDDRRLDGDVVALIVVDDVDDEA